MVTVEMSEFVVKIEHKPTLGSEQEMSRAAMEAKIKALPIKWKKVKLTDYYYFAPSWNDWKKIIEYEKPRLPKYYTNKFDCENFAGWFRHKVAEDFKKNTCAEAEGFADVRGLGMERHSWTIFTDGTNFYQMETQTGVVMDIDDPNYIPDEIVMG